MNAISLSNAQEKLLDELRSLRANERSLREENATLRVLCQEKDASKVLQRYETELNLMREISLVIVSELDLKTVLNLVARKAAEVIQAETLLVPMINQDRQRYTYLAAVGENAEEIIGTDHKIHVGMCGWVLVNERPLLFGQPEEWWMNNKTHWEEGMASALLVPLIGKQGIIGGLSGLGKKGGGSFSERDLELLSIFASQVGVAVENARLFGELSDLAANLEQRVAQRTAELAKANEQIIKLNRCLSEENLRMGTELEITRRLQQMILPRTEELQQIDELDIAGFMEPASEVGGDYYDVLRHDNGSVKISIGDVTGHGLESGVLMLMVQTAVRTLLAYGVSDPKLFMCALNRVIYDNVKRMQSDKNLTLSLIDYKEGKLSLSGQHEEVLLVRAGGAVERIDTIDLGFMVGLEPDISAFVAHSEWQLRPGDTLVLYTDGITEARNAVGKQYGVEHLCRVLQKHWHESAHAIQEAVVSSMRRHIGNAPVCDDLTLLVIKQKIAALAA